MAQLNQIASKERRAAKSPLETMANVLNIAQSLGSTASSLKGLGGGATAAPAATPDFSGIAEQTGAQTGMNQTPLLNFFASQQKKPQFTLGR